MARLEDLPTGITAVEATSNAASATEVLRNILSSDIDFAMAKSYWEQSENLVTKTSECPVSYRCLRRNEKPALRTIARGAKRMTRYKKRY